MFTIRRATTAVGAAALITLAATGCGATKFAAPSQTLPATPGAHLTKAPTSTTATTTRTAVSTDQQATTASSAPAATTPTTTTPVTAAPTTVAPTTPAAVSPAAAPLPTVTLGSFTGIKPTSINFSGDGGNTAANINWSVWTPTGATGIGTLTVDDCNPDCADGHETSGQVVLGVHTVVNGQFTSIDESSPLLPQPETFTLPSKFITTN